jgi:VanZ family protein
VDRGHTTTIGFRLALIVAAVMVLHLATTPLHYPVVEDVNDKASHVLAFFGLALLLDFSFPDSGLGWRKILALLAFGLLIEAIQYHLPYRTFSLLDWAADGLGVVVYGLSLPGLRYLPVLRRRWKVTT